MIVITIYFLISAMIMLFWDDTEMVNETRKQGHGDGYIRTIKFCMFLVGPILFVAYFICDVLKKK